MNRRILFAAVLICTVAACAPHIEFPEPPDDKLVCPDEPSVPAAPVTDEKNSDYLKDLRSAWAGCKGDVDWLRTWVQELNR